MEVYAKNYNLLHAAAGSPKNASSLSRPFYLTPPHNPPPFPPLRPPAAELDAELLAAVSSKEFHGGRHSITRHLPSNRLETSGHSSRASRSSRMRNAMEFLVVATVLSVLLHLTSAVSLFLPRS